MSGFNGKEKDFESGFHYYGARYYESELLTGWLGVDPMMDKYPSISPYAYCAWNPVKLVDSDGRLIDDYFSQDGQYLGSDKAKTHNIRIITEYNWSILPIDEYGVVMDNDLSRRMSMSFSDASSLGKINEEAQLKVYQHYNNTGKTLTNNDGKGSGMITCVTKDSQGNTRIKLKIKLKNNYLKNKNGWALCDNADEIISSFIHEKNHIDRAETLGYDKWLNLKKINPYDIEETAVNAQKRHESWSGCSTTFQTGVEKYLNSFKKDEK